MNRGLGIGFLDGRVCYGTTTNLDDDKIFLFRA